VVEMRLATTYLGDQDGRVRSLLRMAPQEANAVAA
jgi:hypothetical protein